MAASSGVGWVPNRYVTHSYLIRAIHPLPCFDTPLNPDEPRRILDAWQAAPVLKRSARFPYRAIWIALIMPWNCGSSQMAFISFACLDALKQIGRAHV